MEIIYSTTIIPGLEDVIELYKNAKLSRPVNDYERMKAMVNASFFVTAWDGELLIGLTRCLTDFSWSCYLVDLVVRIGYQRRGIGRELIKQTRDAVTGQSNILLLSVPTALEYYPKTGFTQIKHAFMIARES